MTSKKIYNYHLDINYNTKKTERKIVTETEFHWTIEIPGNRHPTTISKTSECWSESEEKALEFLKETQKANLEFHKKHIEKIITSLMRIEDMQKKEKHNE